MTYEGEIVPPCLYAAAEGAVFVKLRKFAFELIALFDMALGWLIEFSEMDP